MGHFYKNVSNEGMNKKHHAKVLRNQNSAKYITRCISALACHLLAFANKICEKSMPIKTQEGNSNFYLAAF